MLCGSTLYLILARPRARLGHILALALAWPAAVLLTYASKSRTKYHTKLALFVFVKSDLGATVRPTPVADNGNVSLLPLNRIPEQVVNLDEFR